ncbi:SAF domain-containing protein [Mycolicibacterium mengxianglii]|uniref:SAF domain-containing protein n=1 Tax=Mycolicibacterium mengxianglii TaxID=2736649 RepID=UPI0018D1212C|nr:SAF domain-containing protein [Mycolicibacterium mengxianglii]
MGHGRAESVDPTLATRIRHVLQPDWVHSIRARRIAAGVLVLLAGAAAVRPDPADAHTATVVAIKDLTPGVVLTASDVHTESRLTATLPEGAQTQLDAVVGATPAGPVRRGEILTDVRLLGPRLTEAAAGPDARVVPLQLAQSAVLDVVREGDVVDIVAAPQSDPDPAAAPRVVATDAVVVLVSAERGGIGAGDRVVLVALPAASATAVAAATLVHTLTLTLH